MLFDLDRPSLLPKAPAHEGSLAVRLRGLGPGARPTTTWWCAALGLLRCDPRECDALGQVFEHERSSDDVRALVLDLLAGAGTAEAQILMRRLLSLSVARRSSATFASYVQRLGYVERPDGPTLRFLMSVYAESLREADDVRAACAYALGVAAGKAFALDADAAVRASDVLRRDLLGAATVAARCALLAALGNVGAAIDDALFARFTQHPEAPVRAAAALALRKTSGAPARLALVALVADRELAVARTALLALASHELSPDELLRLATLEVEGRVAPQLDEGVLQLLARPSSEGRPPLGSAREAVERALRLLLARIEECDASELTGAWGSGERQVAAPPAPPPHAGQAVAVAPLGAGWQRIVNVGSPAVLASADG
jgi:hypothetical protein